jgi:large conductance mechanosensitive channel
MQENKKLKIMKILDEFKAFAIKGNVLDLAVAVVIGGAFGKITSSFVSDIMMPPIGVLLGRVDFQSLRLVLVPASTAGAAVTINYGSFLQNVVDFLIIAFAVFSVVKFSNRLVRKDEKKPEEKKAPEPSTEEKLLMEIRDILKEK